MKIMNSRKDWINSKLENLLDYTQPTNYIVDSTEYNDNYETPVLTAGKSFILGYSNEKDNLFKNLPTIIFDDFTTAIHFVNFPFKVKSSAMKILTPTSKYVDIKYVYYFMKTVRINFDTHKRYWISIFSQLPIKLAPLPEQRAIVGKIQQLFSDLDNGIANLKQAQEQLKVYRQAVLKKAFEGELTKEWREQQTDLPSAEELLKQIKAEREKHYAEQLENWKQAVFDWEAKSKPGKKPTKPRKLIPLTYNKSNKLPLCWFYDSLEVLADAVDPQPSHRTPAKSTDGIPYVGISEFDKNTGKINFDRARKVGREVLDEHIERYDLHDGDFVIGKIGTIGKPFFIPSKRFFTLSANVVLIQPYKNLSISKYLFYLTLSPFIETQFTKGAKATTQAAFGIKKVRTLKVPLCSLAEQEQIVSEIESRLSVCDNVEANIEASLQQSEALRQSILNKAFDGKLLTESELAACRAEPDWEPAEKLLQRIKSEKEEK